ncbi:MAG: flavin reductase [Bacilli bacterium]
MNKETYFNLSYGMYLITAVDMDGKKVGCIANCAIQITSNPSQMLVSLNHDNYTNVAIRETKKLAIMVLAEDVKPETIGNFGFKSSRNVDKFEGIPFKTIDGLPIVDDAICYFILNIKQELDTNTHTLFVGEVSACEMIKPGVPMTYSYYHKVKKGLSPKNAPTYQENKNKMSNTNEKTMHHFKCLLCGYIYETEDEELPDDFTCPVCGAPKSEFEKID